MNKMKFSCDKEILLKSIDIVSKAIATNNAVDILKGMKIDVGEKIKFTGSDGNISIESEFGLELSPTEVTRDMIDTPNKIIELIKSRR